VGGHRFVLLHVGWIFVLLGSSIVSNLPPLADEPSRTSPVSYYVQRVGSRIVVDGALDEPAWCNALSFELNYEVRPGENVPPPVRTVLRVTYDDRTVYFGFEAFDPDPSEIRARYSDRDEAWEDDWVGVVIDTFNDQRRAYELISNPLGVQMDAVNDDVHKHYDDSWNAIWHSAGRITEQGYEVEMAVPFSQIRFQHSNGQAQVWGFDAIRSYPRSDRHHIGLFPRDRGNNSYLSQTVKLVGMEGASPGHNLELLPTLTAVRIDARGDPLDGERERGTIDPEPGATIRWGITPNVSLNGAVNPDFSQVEADTLQLNINEQFDLFFPETRPFFLEGADYFTTALPLVHTRVVVDPAVAAKVTGKQGRSTYGVFSAHDDITTMLFPGPEDSSSAIFDLETTDTVGRYRFDFGHNSTVGATVTDRRGGDYLNQVASLDTTFRFTEADHLTASISASRTRYAEEMIEDGGSRSDRFRDSATKLQYEHSVRNWWVYVHYIDFGEWFRADLGFLPQVDVREGELAGAKIWWGDPGNFHRRMAWGASVRHAERHNGNLINERVETWFNIDGPRQSRIEVSLSLENKMSNGVRFDDMVIAHTRFRFQATDDLKLIFHLDYGDWIDFTNTQPATRTLIQPHLRYNLGRHFLLVYAHTYEALDVAGGRLYTAHAPELRFVCQFNVRAFIRAIVRYQDIASEPSLYKEEVPARARDLFTELLFAHKINPHTAVYVGYSDKYTGTEEFDMTQASRTLFVKLAYAWMR
jgi:hypothetical protein